MQYKPHRLARSYMRELGERLRAASFRPPALLPAPLRRGLESFALWWAESLQYRYVRYRAGDITRSLQHMRHSPQLVLIVCICASMSLGFIDTHAPADATPNYFVRVSLSRPQITNIEDKRQHVFTAAELLRLYELGLIDQSDWFVSASASPVQEQPAESAVKTGQSDNIWRSSSGFVAVNGNDFSLQTTLGSYSLPTFRQIPLQNASTPLSLSGLSSIASGKTSPEMLLADLSGTPAVISDAEMMAAKARPEWDRGGYGTEVFSGPRLHWTGSYLPAEQTSDLQDAYCRIDRMETASWLNLLGLQNYHGSITARQASKYSGYVEHFADRYSLSPSLVMAIMRVESNFNPMVVSSANALGLMQVVPQTAGGEVHAFLTGKKGTPRPEILFKPEQNIQYGTAYLHLLGERHFKDVKNPIAREMCIIAAYNCGPGQVMRVFSRDRKRAFELINALTPEQLYTKLVTSLPHQETRDYLPKVLSARNEFIKGTVKF